MTVNVLGTEYTLDFVPETDDDGLADCDGYCDDTIKRLVVKQYKRDEHGEKKNLELQEQKNHRHEIIHAFMEESGLSGNFEHKTIGIEETTVDWFAIQSPKIFKVFTELDLL